jgi:copper chaperone CopZ
MLRISRFAILPGRLLTAPRLGAVERSGDSSTFAIDGLVCSVCASRTSAALGRVPGVQAVEVDLASGCVALQHDAALETAALARALDSVVVMPHARRLIERVARGFASRRARSVA